MTDRIDRGIGYVMLLIVGVVFAAALIKEPLVPLGAITICIAFFGFAYCFGWVDEKVEEYRERSE